MATSGVELWARDRLRSRPDLRTFASTGVHDDITPSGQKRGFVDTSTFATTGRAALGPNDAYGKLKGEYEKQINALRLERNAWLEHAESIRRECFMELRRTFAWGVGTGAIIASILLLWALA